MKLAIEIGSTCAGDTVKGYIGEMKEQEISAITTSIATSNGTAVLDVTTLPTTTFTGEAALRITITTSRWRWPPMKRLSRIDREALERALAMDPDRDLTKPPPDRRRDPDRWFEAATSASYGLQCDALNPEPWQPVPANEYVSVTDDDSEYGPVMGRAAAAELLRRLLAAVLSRYEPRPAQCARARRGGSIARRRGGLAALSRGQRQPIGGMIFYMPVIRFELMTNWGV